MATWLILLSIGLPWLGGLCVWRVSDKRPGIQHSLASVFSVVGALVTLGLLSIVDDKTVIRIPVGGVFGEFTLIADGLGVYLAIIAAVIGCLAVVFSNDYMRGEQQLSRYYALVLLFIGAMIGLVLAGSMLLIFIFWEITAFCSYALISFHNDDPKAVAGGIKALIITQLGGLGLLAGALISYSYLDSYQINVFLENAHKLPPGVLSFIAFGFLAASAAKSAQVPFQTWLPDAMEAPTPVSALIHAATMVNAGVYLLARFYPAFNPVAGWSSAVIVVGLVSAILAAIMACVTDDLKRVLAYSTISQLGYMIYAIGCGAIVSSQFHLLSHATFKALLFLGAGAVIHATGTRDMRKMGGLANSMPFTNIVFIIGTLGLAGIPVANGFFSKEMVLEGGLLNGPSWAYICMLIGVGITGLYSMRMVFMVFSSDSDGWKDVSDALPRMRISLSILAFGTFTTWLLVGPFSAKLAASLPYHQIHAEDTWETVLMILSSPMTWVALGVVALGMVLWLQRDSLSGLRRVVIPFSTFANQGFGFEWINRKLIELINNTASYLSKLQTGQLNWNVLGIVAGLVVILTLLAWRW